VVVLETLAPIWVDSQSGVEDVASEAAAAGLFALDTEADSLHSYYHKVCLIQLSVEGRHYLLDPLAIGERGLGSLLEVVADPDVTTLMHGADYDVRMLDRDFGGRVGGLQDSQIMAQLLGEPRTGLAALLEGGLGISLDKRFQRADWGLRPIPPQMLAYAAADTAFLASLAHRLRDRLLALGRWSWAEEEFHRLEAVRFAPPPDDGLGFERIKSGRSMRGAARDRLASLFVWRDAEAKRLDRPPFRVLGNAQLVDLAERPPADRGELAQRPGLGPRFVRRWGNQVLRVLSEPSPAPPRRRIERGPQLTGAEKKRMKQLAAERDSIAEELQIQAGLLCPRAILEALVRCPVQVASATDLERCGLAGWRLGVLGERFAACFVEKDR